MHQVLQASLVEMRVKKDKVNSLGVGVISKKVVVEGLEIEELEAVHKAGRS